MSDPKEQAFYYQVLLPAKEDASWKKMQEQSQHVGMFVILKPEGNICNYTGEVLVTSTNCNLEGVKHADLWEQKNPPAAATSSSSVVNKYGGADASLHRFVGGTKLADLAKAALRRRRDGARRRNRARRDDERRAAGDVTPPVGVSPRPGFGASPRPEVVASSTRGILKRNDVTPPASGRGSAQKQLQQALLQQKDSTPSPSDDDRSEDVQDEDGEDLYSRNTGSQNKRKVRGGSTTLAFNRRNDVTGVREKIIVKNTPSPRPDVAGGGGPLPGSRTVSKSPRFGGPGGLAPPGSGRGMMGMSGAGPGPAGFGVTKQITPRLSARSNTPMVVGSEGNHRTEVDVNFAGAGVEIELFSPVPDELGEQDEELVVLTSRELSPRELPQTDSEWSDELLVPARDLSCSSRELLQTDSEDAPPELARRQMARKPLPQIDRDHLSGTTALQNGYGILLHSSGPEAFIQGPRDVRGPGGAEPPVDEGTTPNTIEGSHRAPPSGGGSGSGATPSSDNKSQSSRPQRSAKSATKLNTDLNRQSAENYKPPPITPTTKAKLSNFLEKFGGATTKSLDDTFPNPTEVRRKQDGVERSAKQETRPRPHSRFPGMAPVSRRQPMLTQPLNRNRLSPSDMSSEKAAKNPHNDQNEPSGAGQPNVVKVTVGKTKFRGGGGKITPADEDFSGGPGGKGANMRDRLTPEQQYELDQLTGNQTAMFETPRGGAGSYSPRHDFTEDPEWLNRLAPFEILETAVPRAGEGGAQLRVGKLLHVCLPAYPRGFGESGSEDSMEGSDSSEERLLAHDTDAALLGDLRQRRPGDVVTKKTEQDREKQLRKLQKRDDPEGYRAKREKRKGKEKEKELLKQASRLVLEDTVETELEAEERLRAAYRDSLWHALYVHGDGGEDGEEIPRGQPRHMKIGYAAMGCGSLQYPVNLAAGHAFGGWCEVMRILKGSLYPTLVTIEVRFNGDQRTFAAWKSVADTFLRRNVKDVHEKRVLQMRQRINGVLADKRPGCCSLMMSELGLS